MDSLMTIWLFLIGILIGVISGVVLSFRTAVHPLHKKVERLSIEPKNIESMLRDYPYTPENFRYIGDPVDGIQFEQNTILFIRFKKPNEPSAKEQNHVKELVETGQITWYDHTI
jgi:hypothetical protein